METNNTTPNKIHLVQTTIRCPNTTLEAIDRLAEMYFCSRGSMIRRCLALGLKEVLKEITQTTP
jgi:Tfp pilus assembly pilus retraction ATPase PilT